MACVRKYRGHWVVDWRDPITKKRAIEAVEEDTREAAKRHLAEILKTGEQVGSKATSRSMAIGGLRTAQRERSRRALIRSMRRF